MILRSLAETGKKGIAIVKFSNIPQLVETVIILICHYYYYYYCYYYSDTVNMLV